MVKTLRANLFNGVICAARARTMKHRTKVTGFNDQALSNCPTQMAPIARVPPHPGQGYPVNKRIGQTTGPSSNPPVRKDASRTISQRTNKIPSRLTLDVKTFVVALLLNCRPKSTPRLIQNDLTTGTKKVRLSSRSLSQRLQQRNR